MGVLARLRTLAKAGEEISGGRGGIRTHEGLTPLAVFKTAALNHSATLPYQQDQILRRFAGRTKQEEIRALQTDCKHHPSRSALLIASAALPSSLRKRCAYTFKVIAGEAWPSRFEIVTTSTPLSISSDAHQPDLVRSVTPFRTESIGRLRAATQRGKHQRVVRQL